MASAKEGIGHRVPPPASFRIKTTPNEFVAALWFMFVHMCDSLPKSLNAGSDPFDYSATEKIFSPGNLAH